VDDTREGIERYLKRNPTTCFLAYINNEIKNEEKIVGVILTGHDGRRGIIHHMCVHPDYRRQGIARKLVQKAEDALSRECINKVFGLVFKDNDGANDFWEEQGYTLRTNLNYRNKSLNENVPQGE
jgi:ribosomal protein S18 acetylase RimI-like enzyme